jgi:hypothetical protein
LRLGRRQLAANVNNSAGRVASSRFRRNPLSRGTYYSEPATRPANRSEESPGGSQDFRRAGRLSPARSIASARIADALLPRGGIHGDGYSAPIALSLEDTFPRHWETGCTLFLTAVR